MPRRRRMAHGVETPTELARKLEVLERELALQQAAMDRLKQLATPRRAAAVAARLNVRKTA